MFKEKIFLIKDENLLKQIREKFEDYYFIVQEINSIDEAMFYLSPNLKKKVLVLEDDQDLLDIITSKLKQNNLEVATACSVADGLDCLNRDYKIDLIWLDHFLLGNQTGFDFIASLQKSDVVAKQIPIIVVSNENTLAQHQLYNAFGVEKYYAKSNYSLDRIIIDLKIILKEKKVVL